MDVVTGYLDQITARFNEALAANGTSFRVNNIMVVAAMFVFLLLIMYLLKPSGPKGEQNKCVKKRYSIKGKILGTGRVIRLIGHYHGQYGHSDYVEWYTAVVQYGGKYRLLLNKTESNGLEINDAVSVLYDKKNPQSAILAPQTKEMAMAMLEEDNLRQVINDMKPDSGSVALTGSSYSKDGQCNANKRLW